MVSIAFAISVSQSNINVDASLWFPEINQHVVGEYTSAFASTRRRPVFVASYLTALAETDQSIYSPNGKASYSEISWSLEASRLEVILNVSLWNLTNISAGLLSRCLSIGQVLTRISRNRDFTGSCGTTSDRLMNRGPGLEALNRI